MDANPAGKDITMFQLVRIALDISRDVQYMKGIIQSASVKQSERLVDEWINSQQVMKLLKIKKGTLQNLRDEGILAYTTIKSKIYYKAADVAGLLKSNYRKVNNKK